MDNDDRSTTDGDPERMPESDQVRLSASPAAVTRCFLESLQSGDIDLSMSLLDEDVRYTNVSLPTLHGRKAVERAFRRSLRHMGLRVHVHAIGTDEVDSHVVLTERTDALVFGRVSIQFWVYGRFEIRNGRITVWRDSFDWCDVAVGLLRGVIGAVMPFVGRRWPGEQVGL